MRQEEIEMLSERYDLQAQHEVDLFDAVIVASLAGANGLSQDILNDLDPKTLGVSWWSSLPVQERILIGDYLYQCANGIEVNLAEAKLHYIEWLDARDRINRRIAGSVSVDSSLQTRCLLRPSMMPTGACGTTQFGRTSV
jgi:hypothetical protein